jgi:hypothetical protein
MPNAIIQYHIREVPLKKAPISKPKLASSIVLEKLKQPIRTIQALPFTSDWISEDTVVQLTASCAPQRIDALQSLRVSFGQGSKHRKHSPPSNGHHST